jgi:hypothetical protein
VAANKERGAATPAGPKAAYAPTGGPGLEPSAATVALLADRYYNRRIPRPGPYLVKSEEQDLFPGRRGLHEAVRPIARALEGVWRARHSTTNAAIHHLRGSARANLPQTVPNALVGGVAFDELVDLVAIEAGRRRRLNELFSLE